jgi:hypothetical protein
MLAKVSRASSRRTAFSALSAVSTRGYHYRGVYLHPGPGDIDLHDGADKPEGVPDTWTTADIGYATQTVDFGRFDEDTFPPAIEGETLEQYCRRVPNIWSPCSRTTDVVDIKVYTDCVWAQDHGPARLGMVEQPLVKIPPESADWHVTYVPDYEGMLRQIMFRTRPFPVKVTDEEFEKLLAAFEKGCNTKGLDYHFTARTFHEFWEQLTDTPLKSIADVPTWEEEIDRRIGLAKERNAQLAAEGKPVPTQEERLPEWIKDAIRKSDEHEAKKLAKK